MSSKQILEEAIHNMEITRDKLAAWNVKTTDGWSTQRSQQVN